MIELGIKRWDVREWQEFKVRGLFTWYDVLFSSVPKGMKEKTSQENFNELGLS